MFSDQFAPERFIMEVVAYHESAIVTDLMPVKTEKSLLGFEITNLKNAIELVMQTWSIIGKSQF